MKPFFYLFLSSIVLMSCQSEENPMSDSEENPTIENEENPVSEAFEQNSENLKSLFKAWESQDVDASMVFLADDFVEIGTGFNEPDRNKEEHKAQMTKMMGMMKPTLKNSVFLPGVDSTTLEADGSVRYYGTWNFAIGDKNEDLMVYGTAEFNEEGKITSLAHYADFNMTMMQIMPEEAMEQMAESPTE
ncbi:MAG TPA: hypothetical protein DEO99_04920 [Bacteroidetes bacterium]|nr:hypothetical protein [Bacteroidota bacterium]